MSIDPKNIFIFLNFGTAIQESIKIQNGTQNKKNFLLSNDNYQDINFFVHLASKLRFFLFYGAILDSDAILNRCAKTV
jgi:hypothetical protein